MCAVDSAHCEGESAADDLMRGIEQCLSEGSSIFVLQEPVENEGEGALKKVAEEVGQET